MKELLQQVKTAVEGGGGVWVQQALLVPLFILVGMADAVHIRGWWALGLLKNKGGEFDAKCYESF